MKTASMVLGIIGGAFAILFGLLLIFIISPRVPEIMNTPYFSNYSQSIPLDTMQNWLQNIYTGMGIFMCIGGILGFIGGIIVKNNNTAAGIIMIIGTVLSCINLLILVGAILAFIREKRPAAQYAPYPPYPPFPNAPYPPQNPGYPYQQPYQQNPAYPGQQENQPSYPSQDKPKDEGQN